MTIPRTRIGLGVLAIAMTAAAIHPGNVRAAVQRATITPDTAVVGMTVTVHIETTARIAGAEPGPLLMIPADAFDASPEAMRCSQISEAVVAGMATWRSGRVAFGIGTYDGFIGDAMFAVPDVPTGAYYLGEDIDARGTGCHLLADLTVTSELLPDTAASMRGVDIAAKVRPMPQERGTTAAGPNLRPTPVGLLGLLLVLAILRLVILLGWRDGGDATE